MSFTLGHYIPLVCESTEIIFYYSELLKAPLFAEWLILLFNLIAHFQGKIFIVSEAVKSWIELGQRMAVKGLESCINDVTDYIYNAVVFLYFVSTLPTMMHL